MRVTLYVATFEDLITGSNSSGNQFICPTPGGRRMYCDRIPPDAPQDWEMGPKQKPGEYGVYHEHLWYPRRHGPYAIATAKTAEDAMASAKSFWVHLVYPWVEITFEIEKAATAVAVAAQGSLYA